MTAAAQFDAGHFRHVLGHFTTGVAVITADGPRGPAGMVVSSFTSVSLEPPMVAFLPDKSSTSWPEIQSAGSFCVNILGAGQADVVKQFARKGGDKYENVTWHPAPSGSPVLDGVMAWIDCDLVQTFESGDHYIAIGRVRQLDASGTEPLVFFQGGYKQLGEAVASRVGIPRGMGDATGRTLAELARQASSGGTATDARSTEGLVDEIVGGYVRSFHDQCLAISAGAVTAKDGLERLVGAALGSMGDNRVAIMVLQHERPYLSARPELAYLEPLEREIDAAWLGTLRRGIDSGEFRAGLDAETVYGFIREIMFASARRYGVGRPDDAAVARQADAYRELIMHGLLR